MIPILALILSHLFFPLEANSQNPVDIIRKMDENMRGEASYMEMSMQTVRPRYTREISMRSWSLGEEYSLILITAPARDQGTSFLKRGNEIWNYVPNIDRTIKMPPSMMSQSWMGSDFTNDDLVRGVSVVDDFTHRLQGSETIDGLECYVIEMIPHPDAPIAFDKVTYWVSKKHYLPVKLENFDETDDLVSTIHFREIREMGGRHLPTRMEMVPADKQGHRTIMITHKADFEVNLRSDFFTQQNMRNLQ